MPWKEMCTMGIREDFVLHALAPDANMAALCREYGISRKTGYKWVKRYNDHGLGALEDKSRKPNQSPLKTSADIATVIFRIRKDHPRWGAKKIREILRREVPLSEVPSLSTVHRCLVRSGLLQPMHRRRRDPLKPKAEPPRVVAKHPNDVWTVDFKGWWLSMDKKRCEPLTVRDAYSRFVLEVRILPTNTVDEVQAVFEKLFTKYGLPKYILTDNGPPFVASHGDLGLTRLSVFWLSLGIEHLRTRPGTPSDNGGHERMHKDIAEELQVFATLTQALQQEACDRWRHDFNHHRPHEALGMKMPIEVYRPSEVRYDKTKPVEHVYPEHFLVRRVAKRGAVTWMDMAGQVSHALMHRHVGLEPLERRGHFRVWFGHKQLGEIDYNQKPVRMVPKAWIESAVCHP
jgi:transposase InsO family protein